MKNINIQSDIDLCYDAIDTLQSLGFQQIGLLNKFAEGLPKTKEWVEFVKVPIIKGKVSQDAYNMKWNEKVTQSLIELNNLRSELTPLINFNTSEIDVKIEQAEEQNAIADRWNSYFGWKEQDDKVRGIWKEYQEKFAQLDLGVDGLSIMIVGDEEKSEIRTHYNGAHDLSFFGNQEKENRLLTQYSATQRPVIAILMQLYLLEEKIQDKQDGLRLMWIETPMDKKTRDLLIDIQEKYDITIIIGTTGDFSVENLNEGEFLIENGELLTKNLEK